MVGGGFGYWVESNINRDVVFSLKDPASSVNIFNNPLKPEDIEFFRNLILNIDNPDYSSVLNSGEFCYNYSKGELWINVSLERYYVSDYLSNPIKIKTLAKKIIKKYEELNK